jgi:hypothetical protein
MDFEPPSSPEQQRRQTFLVVFLTGLAGAGFVFFLVLITGGFLLEILAALAGIALFGSIHYLVWGRALSQQVAGQRAAEEERERAEAEEWSFEEHPSRRSY